MDKILITLIKSVLPLALGAIGAAVAISVPIYFKAFCAGGLL